MRGSFNARASIVAALTERVIRDMHITISHVEVIAGVASGGVSFLIRKLSVKKGNERFLSGSVG